MCRMVVQWATVSDLTTHDSQSLHKKYFNRQTHKSGRQSNYLWSELVYPPHPYWQTWWLFLSQVIRYPSLFLPLSDWNTLHHYSHELECQLNPFGGLLYRFDEEQEMWSHFEKIISQCHPKFNITPIPTTQLPTMLIPVDIQIEPEIIILLCNFIRHVSKPIPDQSAQSTNEAFKTLQTQFD